MGYRSDWQLAISGKPLKLQRFMEWWQDKVDKVQNMQAIEMVPYILQNADHIEEDIENGLIVIDGCGWKCYAEFEAAIHTIRQTAVDDFGLETGYARIGEEYADVECESDGDMWVSISRTIERPDNTYSVEKEDIAEYKDYLLGKKGRPVPPDKDRWEDIVNE
jgi:hypothetical protein